MTKVQISNIKAEADQISTLTESEFFDKFHGSAMIIRHSRMKFDGFLTWTHEGVKFFAEKNGEYTASYDDLCKRAAEWHQAQGHYSKITA